MLVTSIFSFSHNVLLRLQIQNGSRATLAIILLFDLSSANALSFDQSKILSFGKEFIN